MIYESKNKDEVYLNEIIFDELIPMTTFYVDKEDSTSFQLFLFKNSLYKNTKEINNSMTKLQSNYITESNKFTNFVLNIDINFESIDNKNEYHFYSSSTVSYSNLMIIYADLLNSQDFYFTNVKYYRKQIADSFLKENFVFSSDNGKIDIHFKAMNNISRKGRIVLMSINYNKLNQDSTLNNRKKSRLQIQEKLTQRLLDTIKLNYLTLIAIVIIKMILICLEILLIF